MEQFKCRLLFEFEYGKFRHFCTKTQEFSPKLNSIFLKNQFSGNSTNLCCWQNAEKKPEFRSSDLPYTIVTLI